MPTTEGFTAQEVMAEYWDSDQSSPQASWDSWKAPHRGQVLIALACIPDATSVYELGCGSGPNLRMIAKHRPELRIGGCDRNTNLAAWASEHLGIPISVATFPATVSADWDVALTCYALAYATPEDARTTLLNLKTRYLILIEPCAYVAPFSREGVHAQQAIGADTLFVPCYAHPYRSLLAETGWTINWRWPLYPDYQGLNTVTIAARPTC